MLRRCVGGNRDRLSYLSRHTMVAVERCIDFAVLAGCYGAFCKVGHRAAAAWSRIRYQQRLSAGVLYVKQNFHLLAMLHGSKILQRIRKRNGGVVTRIFHHAQAIGAAVAGCATACARCGSQNRQHGDGE